MQLQQFEEQIFFAIVRITVTGQSGVGASIGTGFLFRVPVSPSRGCVLLVSCKHVFQNPKHKIRLSFHRSHSVDSDRPDLGQTVAIEQDAFDSLYTEHPNPDIDLACLNVSKIGEQDLRVFYRHLTSDMLIDFTKDTVLPGSDVWFVGYPENRFDTRHNLPILRRGYIASIPDVDFEGRKEFVIDAQVFPGSSGSPVFTPIRGHYKLIGVVNQTMIRNAKLQTVPAAVEVGVTQTIGLGIVLKATLLNELLNNATASIRERLARDEPESTQPV